MCRVLCAAVVEAEAIDQRVVGGKAEESGSGVAGLGVRGECADLDETESVGVQLVEPASVLVETRGEADGVGEREPEALHGEALVFMVEQALRGPAERGDADGGRVERHRDVVGALRTQGKEQGPE